MNSPKKSKPDSFEQDYFFLLSHALRTPLTQLDWGLTIFESEGLETLTDKQQEMLERLKLSSVRIRLITECWFHIQRLERGEVYLEEKTCSLSRVLHNTKAWLGNECEIDFDNVERKIQSDPNLLPLLLSCICYGLSKGVKQDATITVRSEVDTTWTHLHFTVCNCTRCESLHMKMNGQEIDIQSLEGSMGFFFVTSKSLTESLKGSFHVYREEGEPICHAVCKLPVGKKMA